MSEPGIRTAEIRSALADVLPGIRADLERLVRIPSVSADPAARPHVEASAAEVARQLVDAGLPEVEVIGEGGGLPAVVGRRPGPPGAPTVLLYAHHDVQPVGDEGQWATAPFEAVERQGRLYGRGAADDKAGVALHCAALRALGDEPSVGVTVLIDGEEEIGSPTLPALLARHGERLRGDVLVLADSINWRVGVPALTTSLRGGVNVVVEVRTLEHAVHNGAYGGPVPDALTALARLLATLHDDRGDVAVAGLSRSDTDPLDLTDDQLRTDAGVLDGVHLIGTGTLTSRLWTGPALSVIGIDAPSVDEAGMVLVPWARARIALRIGPGDDAAAARDAVVAHLRDHAPWGAAVSVSAGEPVAPYSAETSGPAYAAARAAFADAWGTPPVEIGVGGSIGFLAPFAAAFPDAEILVTGIEDPDTRAHAPNESLHLADFERACLAEALLLERLARR
ncbi:M20/M25/M40 family metallo-hydrolase [Nocardioides sp.]|uniref:M20/M25/M40 family metallo-hydrolase n=1 Tax=Nocardioides sp. TaxID=35761 RepID=UPI002D7FA3E2|nr:M20/M25/M40 family metallo-hydrolase [Nocardioides sp.]HET8959225.1 M20/M25/M40 family metallo-hydrolase [Nocardioides sp.]